MSLFTLIVSYTLCLVDLRLASVAITLLSFAQIYLGNDENFTVVAKFIIALHALWNDIPNEYSWLQSIIFLLLHPWTAHYLLLRQIYLSIGQIYVYIRFHKHSIPDVENTPLIRVVTPPVTYHEFRSKIVSLYLMSLTVDKIPSGRTSHHDGKRMREKMISESRTGSWLC